MSGVVSRARDNADVKVVCPRRQDRLRQKGRYLGDAADGSRRLLHPELVRTPELLAVSP